ncbi:MAG: twin-arginine translocation signal domain-containing protein, partial [Opitutae bacterium]|nr:twin-arginine translocation signal domain-containing protein [Opitutae bacterium]
MKRRTFLKTAGAACTAAALPNLLTSKTKKAIVLGKGDHQ